MPPSIELAIMREAKNVYWRARVLVPRKLYGGRLSLFQVSDTLIIDYC
jgi:hypothetical protein